MQDKMLVVWSFLIIVYHAGLASALAPSGKWDKFNFTPTSKTVYPAAIHSVSGSVKAANKLVDNKGAVTLLGDGSSVTLDFGKEVSIVTPYLII